MTLTCSSFCFLNVIKYWSAANCHIWHILVRSFKIDWWYPFM
jgi:hypothetical protein